jgi:hypothetical protein
MVIAPTSHHIDPANGVLSASTGRYEKRLAELDGIYADGDAFAEAASSEGDRVVYYVHEVRPAAARGDLIFGTTFMEPGRIADEFFVTRGHIHAVGNRPETYYGEAGEGLMLLESPEGETKHSRDRAARDGLCAAALDPPLGQYRCCAAGDELLLSERFRPGLRADRPLRRHGDADRRRRRLLEGRAEHGVPAAHKS